MGTEKRAQHIVVAPSPEHWNIPSRQYACMLAAGLKSCYNQNIPQKSEGDAQQVDV
jgi:hypothetical protein